MEQDGGWAVFRVGMRFRIIHVPIKIFSLKLTTQFVVDREQSFYFCLYSHEYEFH